MFVILLASESSLFITSPFHQNPSSYFNSNSPAKLQASNPHNQNHHHHVQQTSKSLVILANAFNQQQQIDENQLIANYEKENIIQLSSSNFNTQLIQHKSSFKHLILIKYFLPFSKFCAKFKPTYARFAKQIYSWRNVIRLGQIDLANSNNSPIANAWQIEKVPTLRIHPPILNEEKSQFLQEQLIHLNATMKMSELQKSLFGHYNSLNLFIETINVTNYIDKYQELRRHLLVYIRDFVERTTMHTKQKHNEGANEENFDVANPVQLPKTWPNLKPVSESTLSQLLKNHPRRELFLIIERDKIPIEEAAESSSASNQIAHDAIDKDTKKKQQQNLALGVIMDLSSSPAHKAVRYVRANENRALIEDIVEQLNKTNGPSNQGDSLWDSQSSNDHLILIYVDDAHPPVKNGNSELSSGFHSAITKLTMKDLEFNGSSFSSILDSSMSASLHQRNTQQHLINTSKAKRSPSTSVTISKADDLNDNKQTNRRGRRFATSNDESKIMTASDRDSELIVNFINHIQLNTNEDELFEQKLKNFDENFYKIVPSMTTPQMAANPNNNNINNNNLTTTPKMKVVVDHETVVNSLQHKSESKKPTNANSLHLNRLTSNSNLDQDQGALNENYPLSSDNDNNNNKMIIPLNHGTATASNLTGHDNNYTQQHQQQLDLPHQTDSNVMNQGIMGEYIAKNQDDDYGDKLKAIEYIFMKEIVWPGKFNSKMSPDQHAQKLKVIINLIQSIKTWFPLPNAASRQFLDGLERYLLKEQARMMNLDYQDVVLTSTSPHQAASTTTSTLKSTTNMQQTSGVDYRELKQEIDRLRAEGKRFPGVKEYNVCKAFGYSCALWRLFHTLAAFEYQTLNQITNYDIVYGLISNSPNAASLTSPPSGTSGNPVTITPTTSTTTKTTKDDNETNNNMKQQQNMLIENRKLVKLTSTKETSNNNNNNNNINQDHNNNNSNHNHEMMIPSPSSSIGRLISPPATAASLSLTITTNDNVQNIINNNINNSINSNGMKNVLTESDLPTPVLLVMKDYITNFFSCEECQKNFESETSDITLDRIRREKPEFSILELWKIHNKINKRLAVTSEKNPPENPKIWYPSYNQCKSCYDKLPSYILPGNTKAEEGLEPAIMFAEPIQWNEPKVVEFLEREYTKNPLSRSFNLYHCNYWSLIIIASLLLLTLIVMAKWFSSLIERQRRHKTNLLNGSANGARYSVELQ